MRQKLYQNRQLLPFYVCNTLVYAQVFSQRIPWMGQSCRSNFDLNSSDKSPACILNKHGLLFPELRWIFALFLCARFEEKNGETQIIEVDKTWPLEFSREFICGPFFLNCTTRLFVNLGLMSLLGLRMASRPSGNATIDISNGAEKACSDGKFDFPHPTCYLHAERLYWSVHYGLSVEYKKPLIGRVYKN